MAVGTKTFSTEGRQVKKQVFTPAPAKDWEGRIMVETVKVAVAAGAGKLPYVQANIELLDSALAEGGKNRRLFKNFFLGLDPSDKDGVAMVDRQDGIVAFSKAVATGLACTVTTKMHTKDDGSSVEAEILDPQSVVKWLKQFDGMVFKLHSKIEKGTSGYQDKAVVDYFIESDLTEQPEEGVTPTEEAPEEEAPAEEELPPPPKAAAKAKKK